jgi:prophage regulatory protein
MGDRLLTWPQVAARVPYTRQHCGRLERENKFPRRVQVGENRVAWLETEIDAWIESRKRVPLDEDGDGEAAAGEFVVRRLQRPDEQEEGAGAAAEEAASAAAE